MEKTAEGVVLETTPTKTKKVILVKELNKVLYALAVRTCTDMVYDRKYQYTLTELLDDIQKALTDTSFRLTKLNEKFERLMKDAPDEMDTLKEVWDYVNIDGRDEEGNPKSVLIQLIESKVDKEEGKGLSTHDLTDLLYTKLINDYTKEELDQKFDVVENRVTDLKETVDYIAKNATMQSVESIIPPEGLKEGTIWFQITSKEED